MNIEIIIHECEIFIINNIGCMLVTLYFKIQ